MCDTVHLEDSFVNYKDTKNILHGYERRVSSELTMVAPNKERFGKWLKQTREERRLSQDELAEGLGTKKAHVSKMETGKLLPPLNVLAKLVKVLGMPFRAPLIELEYLKETISDADSESLLCRYLDLSSDYREVVTEFVAILWKRDAGNGHQNGVASHGSPPDSNSPSAELQKFPHIGGAKADQIIQGKVATPADEQEGRAVKSKPEMKPRKVGVLRKK